MVLLRRRLRHLLTRAGLDAQEMREYQYLLANRLCQ